MNRFDLEQPIIRFGQIGNSASHWTIRHAVEGVQIFGGIGSGKSSGSGRTLALKYLSLKFGGLVLIVKPDEKDTWVEYCRIAGRSNDLLVLEPGGPYNFNFLEYVSVATDKKTALTENIVEVLKTVIRAGDDKADGKSNDQFWESALDMLMFNTIDLCKLAYDKVTIEDIYNIVQTLPKSKSKENSKDTQEDVSQLAFHKAFVQAHSKVIAKIDAWELTLSEEDNERQAKNGSYEAEILEAIPDARLFKFIDQFFNETFKNLSEKTRSIVEFTFSGFLFRLLREPVYSLFCRNHSTITPEASLEGKIILLNLPVKLYHKVGRDSQIMFKYIWQRSMEKRRVETNSRPVFLWADEAQNFLHEHDVVYQATARSSRIATVYISQNLPNYYASMGGDRTDNKVKSFIGTLATKIFHANADIETNKYASELIGEDFVIDESQTASYGKDFSKSSTTNHKLERLVRPEEFVRFKTGGANNNFVVEGIVHIQGDVINNNRNHKKIFFRQNYKI